MKICCIILLFVEFAFAASAGETNDPACAIFRQYDEAVKSKITDHWFELVDAMPLKTPEPAGKVDLEFHPFPDGHVSDVKVVNTNAPETLVAPCKKAITDSAPFPRWATEIRQAYTNDFRVINFTVDFK